MHDSSRSRLLASALLATTLPAALAAQGQFVDIPGGASTAVAVSDDGTVVTGWGTGGAFLWTAAGGTQYISSSAGPADLSADGSVVAGTMPASAAPSGLQEAAYWTQAGGWVNLGGIFLGTPCDSFLSSASGISKDGQVIVGLGWSNCFGRAVRWTALTGMVDLGLLGERASANAVSGDGAVVGGWDQGRTTLRRAAVWFPIGTAYSEMLIIPPSPANPNGDGEVWGLNHNGSVIVGGENASEAFRWKNGVFQRLGGYPGSVGGDTGRARATNEDGSMIVGVSGSMTSWGPFLWTEEDGMQLLPTFLADQGIAITPGPPLTWAFDISPSGYHIVGRRGEPIILPGAFAYWVELPAGVRYGLRHGGNNTMRLRGTGSTALGGTLTVTTDQITSSNLVSTLIGVRSMRLPLLGGTLLVDLTLPHLVVPGLPSGGASSFSLTIPQVPAAVGAALYMQTVVIDPAAGGVFYSNGIKATIT